MVLKVYKSNRNHSCNICQRISRHQQDQLSGVAPVSRGGFLWNRKCPELRSSPVVSRTRRCLAATAGCSVSLRHCNRSHLSIHSAYHHITSLGCDIRQYIPALKQSLSGGYSSVKAVVSSGPAEECCYNGEPGVTVTACAHTPSR